ncbi:hypothetical protein PARU111607_13930 [Palleronia rufa]
MAHVGAAHGQGASGGVRGPRDDRHARKVQGLCGRTPQPPGHRGGPRDRRQRRGVQTHGGGHGVAPPPLPLVVELGARGIGRVGGRVPGQPKAQMILGQQDGRDRGVDGGLRAPQPVQLGRGEGRHRPHPGDRQRVPRRGAGPAAAPCVVPQDRRPQRPVVRAQRQKPVHLPRQPDGAQVGADRGRARRHLAHSRARRRHPDRRILLRQARRGHIGAVVRTRFGQHALIGAAQQRLQPGRAKIEPQIHLRLHWSAPPTTIRLGLKPRGKDIPWPASSTNSAR